MYLISIRISDSPPLSWWLPLRRMPLLSQVLRPPSNDVLLQFATHKSTRLGLETWKLEWVQKPSKQMINGIDIWCDSANNNAIEHTTLSHESIEIRVKNPLCWGYRCICTVGMPSPDSRLQAYLLSLPLGMSVEGDVDREGSTWWGLNLPAIFW